MAGLNEIHAAICGRIYGQREERTPGARRKYQWHRYDCLLEMEQGERISEYVSKSECRAFRVMASRYGRDFGVRFQLHYKNGKMTITRTI